MTSVPVSFDDEDSLSPISPISFARTEHARAHLPPPRTLETEPAFRGDERMAVKNLVEQAKRVQLAYERVISSNTRTDLDAARELGDAVRALSGVAAFVKRILGPVRHRLKTDPLPFKDTRAGLKPYEIRTFDRDFQVGDFLELLEFDRETQRYSGETFLVEVTSITQPGNHGLPADVGVMGIRKA